MTCEKYVKHTFVHSIQSFNPRRKNMNFDEAFVHKKRRSKIPALTSISAYQLKKSLKMFFFSEKEEQKKDELIYCFLLT
jgi:hypothetical protein